MKVALAGLPQNDWIGSGMDKERRNNIVSFCSFSKINFLPFKVEYWVDCVSIYALAWIQGMTAKLNMRGLGTKGHRLADTHVAKV